MNTTATLSCIQVKPDIPLLYRIPATHYVRRQRAANFHLYDIPALAQSSTPVPRSYLRRLTAKYREALALLRSRGEAATIKICQWYLLPLVILACFGIAAAAPAELGVP